MLGPDGIAILIERMDAGILSGLHVCAAVCLGALVVQNGTVIGRTLAEPNVLVEDGRVLRLSDKPSLASLVRCPSKDMETCRILERLVAFASDYTAITPHAISILPPLGASCHRIEAPGGWCDCLFASAPSQVDALHLACDVIGSLRRLQGETAETGLHARGILSPKPRSISEALRTVMLST